MDKRINFNLKDIWQIFLIVALPIICVAGISAVPVTLRLPLIYTTGIFFVFMFLFSDIKLKLNTATISVFLFLAFLAISLTYSYDKESTYTLFLLYACAFTLLFIDLPVKRYSQIITVMYVICTVIAFSILLSAVVNNCMLTYFGIIVNPYNTPSVTRAITNELAMGAYSGLAREKTEAAFIMNIGVAISFAKYFSTGKLSKRDTLLLIVFLAAMMLTCKRTLLIICIACFAIFLMISSKVKSKTFMGACVVITVVCVLFILSMFVPSIAHILERFMDNEDIQTMSNRNVLWSYIYRMISSYWQFGAGFGSYRKYAHDKGLTVGNKEWIYDGHNSYLQAFGELGIIGASLLAIFVIYSLYKTFVLIRKLSHETDSSYLLFFSLYVQIMILIYAVTGNPIYTKQIVFIWFFSIGITLSLNNRSGAPTAKSRIKHHQL